MDGHLKIEALERVDFELIVANLLGIHQKK